MPDGVPSVLFLCVHNAGRSQMALGWFNHLAEGRARRGRVGNADSELIEAPDLVDFGARWMSENLRA